MSESDFTRTTATTQDWLSGLLAVWTDGKIETNEIVSEWTDSFKALTASTRTELEELKATADTAGYDKRKGATYCTTPHLTAEQIQNASLKMMGKLMAERTEVLAFYEELLPQLSDTADLENRKAALEREGEAALAALRTLIRENAGSALEQEAYHREHDTLSKQLDAIRERMGEADREILLRRQRRVQTEQVMSSLRAGAWRGDFDEEMFGALVDRVTVYTDRLVFRLKEGTERTVTR